jgi:hypothetical protein
LVMPSWSRNSMIVVFKISPQEVRQEVRRSNLVSLSRSQRLKWAAGV